MAGFKPARILILTGGLQIHPYALHCGKVDHKTSPALQCGVPSLLGAFGMKSALAGGKWKAFKKWKDKWGKPKGGLFNVPANWKWIYARPSWADMAANRKGGLFYDLLKNNFKFDICSAIYGVDGLWVEP